MFNINRVVLVGRLTRDPELRALPSGTSVCSLRIACSSFRRDSDGDLVERPNYFDVSAYGAPGESVSRYMRRGSRVAVDGRLEWREWETAGQERRQAVSIVADTVQFLDRPGEREGADPAGAGDGPLDADGEGHAGAEPAHDGELVGVGVGAGDGDGDELVF
jgi:single-strand DNA-binding protein